MCGWHVRSSVPAGDRVTPRAVANPDRIANKAGEQKAEVHGFHGEMRGLTDASVHLVERLTRLDPDTVAYEYTYTDPTEYTAPYTVMMPFRRTDGPLFEYACHEGNIGLHGILAGARNLEKEGRELRP